MTIETFDFSKTSRWTLLKMLAAAFCSRRLSLAWTPTPEPTVKSEPTPEITVPTMTGDFVIHKHPHSYE